MVRGSRDWTSACVERSKARWAASCASRRRAGPFEITARADRIDRLGDGQLRIYDFKTSANAAKVSAGRGAPQLALEGLLAKEGAFAGIPATSPSFSISSRPEVSRPGEIVTLKMPCAEAIEAAYTGTFYRIARFDDEATPYAYETRAIFREKAETILMRISPASRSGPSRQTKARPR